MQANNESLYNTRVNTINKQPSYAVMFDLAETAEELHAKLPLPHFSVNG